MDDLEIYVRALLIVFGLACAGTLLVSPVVFLVLWAACRISAMMSKGEE